MKKLETAKRLSLTVEIVTRNVWLLPTHWRGRTLLCPSVDVGDRCPACTGERPKTVATTLVRTPGEDGFHLLEISAGAFDRLPNYGIDPMEICGARIQWAREHTRSPWTMVRGIVIPREEPADWSLAVDWIEQLYRLPPVYDRAGRRVFCDNLRDWRYEHQEAAARQIEWAMQPTTLGT